MSDAAGDSCDHDSVIHDDSFSFIDSGYYIELQWDTARKRVQPQVLFSLDILSFSKSYRLPSDVV